MIDGNSINRSSYLSVPSMTMAKIKAIDMRARALEEEGKRKKKREGRIPATIFETCLSAVACETGVGVQGYIFLDLRTLCSFFSCYPFFDLCTRDENDRTGDALFIAKLLRIVSSDL